MTEKRFKIETPTVPNFVRVILPGKEAIQSGATMIAISELSPEEIDSIVLDWKKKLSDNANRQRKNKQG